jgi:adenylate cyclase
VGRKLGAQYVVEGSVQKAEDRVRITAQLIDASTGHHVWSERYDRQLEDIFALQDEITMKIMNAVGMQLVSGEGIGEKWIPPSGSLEVYMKAMKGFERFHLYTKEDNALARREFEEAIALDSEYAICHTMLAITHLMDLYFQSSESSLLSFAQASKNIKKAIALDNEDWFPHLGLSFLHLLRREYDEAITAAERAIALNRNADGAYKQLGEAFIYSGRAEEGIKLIEKAMRLNPIPPPDYLHILSVGYFLLGRYQDAIQMNEMVLKQAPNFVFAHLGLAAAYGALGREEDFRSHAEEVLKLDPTFSVDQYAEIFPLKDRAEFERFIAELRKAGLK